jgi:rSAM/selenodomain-associated transferase 2
LRLASAFFLTEALCGLSIAVGMKLSVIIPVLNEREHLPQTIVHLIAEIGPAEIIVVDGGSTDGTREWLAEQTGLLIVDAKRGRGRQLQAGAKIATGDVLLFLHADCWLPRQAVSCIQQSLKDTSVIGGAFLIRFFEQRPRSLFLIAKGINARSRVTKTATGDQGIFVRRESYELIGGFEAWPLFEDVRLVTKLKRLGSFVILREPVIISGRRYAAHGPWRTTFLMYALRLGYWLGIAPEKLYGWFTDVRTHIKV